MFNRLISKARRIVFYVYYEYMRPAVSKKTKLELKDNHVIFYTPEYSIWSHVDAVIRSEREIIEVFLRTVGPGDVVWDVGAAEGVYTILAASLGADVVAFEPYEPRRRLMKKNIGLNECNSSVTVLSEALAHTAGERTFSTSASDVGGGKTSVRTISGDELLDKLPAPQVIKMDIEGAELEALKGMKSVLNKADMVLCEVHPPSIQSNIHGIERSSVEQVRILLEQSGFKVRQIGKRDEQPFLMAHA